MYGIKLKNYVFKQYILNMSKMQIIWYFLYIKGKHDLTIQLTSFNHYNFVRTHELYKQYHSISMALNV